MKLLRRLLGLPADKAATSTARSAPDLDPTAYGPPVSFGYKINWFALRTADRKKIAALMGIEDPRPVSWRDGVAAAYYPADSAVLLTPPIHGWTLVAGTGLPGPCDESANSAQLEDGVKFRRLFGGLSARFPEVQFFGSHRVVDYAAWALARNGNVERVFAFVGSDGEVTVNQGRQTAEEAALGFVDLGLRSPKAAATYFFDLLDREDEHEGVLRTLDPVHPFQDRLKFGEEHVIALASAWSVDPTGLDVLPGVTGICHLGRLGPG